ncbi:MAG: DNA adenine methylase [Deltaproteobacteria bacterium]|nr:DNA adenine methylase [Deltaproteobacteria bacterium]
MSEQLTLDSSFRKKDDWDFAKAETKRHVHGIHPYPARMIPQIAEKLLNMFAAKNQHDKFKILDPFCGSGTVLVESIIKGYHAIGIDINPFAVLLSRIKTITKEEFEDYLEIKNKILTHLEDYNKSDDSYFIPDFFNIGHWFKQTVMHKLSHIYEFINSQNENSNLILKTAFAKTIMDSSNVNWKSSRYIRVYPKEKIEQLKPNVFLIFKGALQDVEKRVQQFLKLKKGIAEVIKGDSRILPIPNNSIDLIITSPPYGEERNTIPYIRWSKLFLLWMNFSPLEIREFEKIELGGQNHKNINFDNAPSPTFWEVVDGLPEERISEAGSFIEDYISTLGEFHRKLKRRKKCCIVIGNRGIKRRYLDMGKVTIELARKVGYKVHSEFKRKIPNKMIPWTGPTGDTISDERIVILEKK